MTSTFAEGIARIRALAARKSNIGANNCKLRTREAFEVPSNGTATAARSWYAAPDKNADRNPSRAPAYSFGWMTGGGKGSGHVVVNLGNGRILTPGGPSAPARWYETTAAELLRAWPNLKWVGWTRTIDGKAPALPAPKPKPAPVATPLLRPIYHDKNYAKANSPTGDSIAAARHQWADRDIQRCLGKSFGIFINTHWPDPKTEGFRDRRGKVPRLPFRLLPWSVVKTLTSRDGHRIRTGGQTIRDAKKAGYPGIEFELKFVPSQKGLDRLTGVAREVYGPKWVEHVEFKMSTRFRWKTGLRRAKRTGAKTTVIEFSGDPKKIPHAYVDHYRRP